MTQELYQRIEIAFRAIALKAGDVIMEVYARPDFEARSKSDNSPVTEADEAADVLIRAELIKVFPDIAIVTEELSESHSIKATRFIIVDPLDGTKEFVKRRGDFTVNIALVENGVTVRGVVYAPAKDRLFYTRLTQRWQHPLDVPKEHAVRTDDKHALVLEREPVRVEQVGSAVQRDDGFARAGPALDDEHTVLRRPDDLVLFALNGCNDVAERAGAATLDRGEQRRVAAQPRVVGHDDARISIEPLVVSEPEVPVTEQFVFDPEEIAALDDEMAPPRKTHRLAPGRSVERLRDRSTPVDHHRLAILVCDRKAADVERFGLVGSLGEAIDPAEHERGIAEVEVFEPLHDRFVERIALETGLKRAAEVGFVHVADAQRGRAAGDQALVGVVDVGLFVGEIGMLLGHNGAQKCYRRTRPRPPARRDRHLGTCFAVADSVDWR